MQTNFFKHVELQIELWAGRDPLTVSDLFYLNIRGSLEEEKSAGLSPARIIGDQALDI